jgi:hypothetical protein
MVMLAPIAFGLSSVEMMVADKGSLWVRWSEMFSQGAMTLAAVAGGLSVWNMVEHPFRTRD